jgi:hypothetical protein
MNTLFKDKEHLVRAVGLALVSVLVFLVARQMLVPKDFGVYGHFRAGALDDNRARPLAFAGQAQCLECHDEVASARRQGKHAGVACEACHGALASHAAGSEAKPSRPDPRGTCLICHTPNLAKPKSFPQIQPKEHGDAGPCTACHAAHNPGQAQEVKR